MLAQHWQVRLTPKILKCQFLLCFILTGKRNFGVGQCNGQTYLTRLQICCENQIWEDPHGLYTCCGAVPCLTDVGVSVYQVFQGKYTDGLSEYIGPQSSRKRRRHSGSVFTGLQNPPVRVPPGTMAVQFSNGRMRAPYYVSKVRSEFIPDSAYPLPPPKPQPTKLLVHIPMQAPPQQQAQPPVMVPTQYVPAVPASPSVFFPANAEAASASAPQEGPRELTIRIEADGGVRQMKNADNLAEFHRASQPVQQQKMAVQSLPASEIQQQHLPIEEYNHHNDDELQRTNAELMEVLQNLEMVADVNDGNRYEEDGGFGGRRSVEAMASDAADILSQLVDSVDDAHRLQLESLGDGQSALWNPHIPPSDELMPAKYQTEPLEARRYRRYLSRY